MCGAMLVSVRGKSARARSLVSKSYLEVNVCRQLLVAFASRHAGAAVRRLRLLRRAVILNGRDHDRAAQRRQGRGAVATPRCTRPVPSSALWAVLRYVKPVRQENEGLRNKKVVMRRKVMTFQRRKYSVVTAKGRWKVHHGDDATTRHSMSALTELAAEGSDGATATTATTAWVAERGASPSDDEGGVVASSAPGGSQPAAEGRRDASATIATARIAEGGASSEEDEGNSGSKLAAEGSGGDATAAERGASSDEDEGDGGSELHAAEGSGGDATAAERSASSDEDEDEDDAGGAELGARNFQRHVEDFECEHCGAFVEGDGYTNHCPACLWCKHGMGGYATHFIHLELRRESSSSSERPHMRCFFAFVSAARGMVSRRPARRPRRGLRRADGAGRGRRGEEGGPRAPHPPALRRMRPRAVEQGAGAGRLRGDPRRRRRPGPRPRRRRRRRAAAAAEAPARRERQRRQEGGRRRRQGSGRPRSHGARQGQWEGEAALGAAAFRAHRRPSSVVVVARGQCFEGGRNFCALHGHDDD